MLTERSGPPDGMSTKGDLPDTPGYINGGFEGDAGHDVIEMPAVTKVVDLEDEEVKVTEVKVIEPGVKVTENGGTNGTAGRRDSEG